MTTTTTQTTMPTMTDKGQILIRKAHLSRRQYNVNMVYHFKKLRKKSEPISMYKYLKGHQHSSSYKGTSLQNRWNFLEKKYPRVHFAFSFVFKQSYKMHYNVWKMYISSFCDRSEIKTQDKAFLHFYSLQKSYFDLQVAFNFT